MKNWQKNYKPYEGSEPYLYFAFADTDLRKVWPVMKILLQRGCRVWYCTGPAGNSQELIRRQERAAGAVWTLLYLSDALVADKESKSRVMVNQKDHKKITSLDTDGTHRYLAMDLRESTPSIPLHRCKTAEELEDALIRGEGYSQMFVGKPMKLKSSWLSKLTATFVLLTLLLVGGSAVYSMREPVYDDSVTFSDSVIREAVRKAAGGGSLDPERLQMVQAIRLEELPESWDDLSMLPGLETIGIPQSAALQAENLPLDTYRIVLYGGVS